MDRFNAKQPSILLFALWTFFGGPIPIPPVSFLASAQVATNITPDGSLGTTVTQTGNLFDINGGSIVGPNQFQSFDRFDVGSGDIASFNGPPVIVNILSRVTGGNPSNINGTIQSTINGASLFFFNPRGVVFGPDAQLNVTGSFHASTADFLRFADGAEFHADLSQNSVLTAASPEAFGFLSQNPAPITSRGALEVPQARTLSLVGGDIDVNGGSLRATSGFIDLVSVASPGAVPPYSADQMDGLSLETFERLGTIEVSNNVLVDTSGSFFGAGSGTVRIRGGRLLVDDAIIRSRTLGSFSDGAELGVDIAVAESVTLDNASNVGTNTTFGIGSAGGVRINGHELTITNGSLLNSTAFFGQGSAGDINVDVEYLDLSRGGRIDSSTLGDGEGGRIEITARKGMRITGRSDDDIASAVTSFTSGIGNAGSIEISTPELFMEDSFIGAGTLLDSGRGGDIEIKVGDFTSVSGATVDTSSLSTGQGGAVSLIAEGKVTISGVDPLFGEPGGIFSAASGDGKGGDILVMGESFYLTAGSGISAEASGAGDAGNVMITVTDTFMADNSAVTTASEVSAGGSIDLNARALIELTETTVSASVTGGDKAGGVLNLTSPTMELFASSIEALTSGAGPAGNIEMNVDSLLIAQGTRINTSSQGQGPIAAGGTIRIQGTGSPSDLILISGEGTGLFTNTTGEGKGGDIEILTRKAVLTDGAIVSAESTGPGDAGNVDVHVTDRFSLERSSVITRAEMSDGGNIRLTSSKRINLFEGEINAEVNGGPSTIGGNITIGSGPKDKNNPQSVTLNESKIIANAFEGTGGNINIFSDLFLASTDSTVDASSEKGIDGEVNIESGVRVLSGTLAPLPEQFLSATELLRESCAARHSTGHRGSLLLKGREGLPIEPQSSWPSPPLTAPGHTATNPHDQQKSPLSSTERLNDQASQNNPLASLFVPGNHWALRSPCLSSDAAREIPSGVASDLNTN